jgi:hypothetical protein
LLNCSDDHASSFLAAVREILAIPQNPHVWTLLSCFQTNPTKLNPLPLMFHPISPVSGTDGKMNLIENVAMSPVRMRENTSVLQFDIREPVADVHNAAES